MINIYATTRGNVTKREQIKELIKLVNDVFDTHFGFRRITNSPAPELESNVDRQLMRFRAFIKNTGEIYREGNY